jgi:hypothetical protein
MSPQRQPGPIWSILSEGKFELVLANAAHVKNVPGRKTDERRDLVGGAGRVLFQISPPRNCGLCWAPASSSFVSAPVTSSTYKEPSKRPISHGRASTIFQAVPLGFMHHHPLRAPIPTKIHQCGSAIGHARCIGRGGGLLELSGEPDHVHLRIALPPNLDLSTFVNTLKTTSSRLLGVFFGAKVY